MPTYIFTGLSSQKKSQHPLTTMLERVLTVRIVRSFGLTYRPACHSIQCSWRGQPSCWHTTECLAFSFNSASFLARSCSSSFGSAAFVVLFFFFIVMLLLLNGFCKGTKKRANDQIIPCFFMPKTIYFIFSKNIFQNLLTYYIFHFNRFNISLLKRVSTLHQITLAYTFKFSLRSFLLKNYYKPLIISQSTSRVITVYNLYTPFVQLVHSM